MMSAAERAVELMQLSAEGRKDALDGMSEEEQAAILLCLVESDREEALRGMSDEDQTVVRECMQCMQQVDKEPETITQQLPHISEVMRSNQLSALHSKRAITLRLTLTQYYSKHAPEEVAKVENLVARVVGGPPTEVGGGMVLGGIMWSEEELSEKIEAKYGAKVEIVQAWSWTHVAVIAAVAVGVIFVYKRASR